MTIIKEMIRTPPLQEVVEVEGGEVVSVEEIGMPTEVVEMTTAVREDKDGDDRDEEMQQPLP